ncbi:unnamed protein product [Symbiodinium sp. CCMP2592]|nr:unnamed protein product [Symbiodinium sp. CCMP2592]
MEVRPRVMALSVLLVLCVLAPLAQLVSIATRRYGVEKQERRAKGGHHLSASQGSTAAPCRGTRLVVHVGPQKTGTTAIQDFLDQNADWLRTQGLTVGFHGFPHANCMHHCQATALYLHCKRQVDMASQGVVVKEQNDTFSFLQSKLSSSKLVVLSSEAFTKFDNGTWRCFKSQVGADTCLSAVVFHRNAADWVASQWSQASTYDSTPVRFSTYLAKSARDPADAHGDVDGQLKLLNKLAVFDRVVPVSYDYLKEVNCSGAAFLICNASLGLVGTEWLQCKRSVDIRQTFPNKSPPRAAIDVVRLARDFYEIKQAMQRNSSPCNPWPITKMSKFLFYHPETVPISRNPAIVEAAKHVPVKCARLDALFHHETGRWFSRTGAKRPGSRSRPICTADVAAFEAKHWRLIGKIAPHC